MNELTPRDSLLLFLGYFFYHKESPFYHKIESVYRFIKGNNVDVSVEQIDKIIQDCDEVLQVWHDEFITHMDR